MKQTFIIVALLLVIGIGAYLWYGYNSASYESDFTDTSDTTEVDELDTDHTGEDDETETDLADPRPTEREPQSVIGSSANGTSITAYHFGNGATEILFIGGVHGGYSFNTSLVAFQLIDHLESNPNLVPEHLTITVIPILNPDGVARATNQTGRFTAAQVSTDSTVRTAARFNGNNVDINRNFDCEWRPEAVWQNQTVSGGAAPFSEPEARAIRNYVTTHQPTSAVVWYSAAGGAYASECGDGIIPETRNILDTYATASGYTAYDSFDFYAITGDMVNWFASQNIPAISVLLTDRENTEWNRNRAGIEALINHYAR